MMQKIGLGILFVSLFVLAACTSNGGVTSTSPFVGGSEGLIISFSEGAPPDEILDDEQFEFNVNVRVENAGEADVEPGDGYVEIEGISAAEFGVSSSALRQNIPEIDGATKAIDGTIINGLIDFVDFDELNYQPSIAGTLTTKVRAHACYNYETQAVANLCVKEDTIDNIQDNEVCQISGDKFYANSGGPIQIKGVTETPKSRDGITVLITIGTVGPATDSWYRIDTECDNRRNNPDRYKVYVEVDPLNNGQIPADCSSLSGNGNSGFITLTDGVDRQFSCSFDTSSVDSDFETRMNVKLSYRYSEFIEKDIVIRDVTPE